MVRPRRDDRAVEVELGLHVEFETEDLIRQGLAPEEARRRALAAFGGTSQVREQASDVRGIPWLGALVSDVRYAGRRLWRAPGFALTAIVTLALGVGATTAIFSVADAAVFRPALYPDPERIVRIYLEPHGEKLSGGFFTLDGRRLITPSAVDFKLWASVARNFDSIATATSATVRTLREGPEVENLTARAITENYLRVYGIQPLFGRAFTTDDHQPGAAPVVMLGHRFWRDRFAGDPAVLGSLIRFEQGQATGSGPVIITKPPAPGTAPALPAFEQHEARIVGVLPPSLLPHVHLWRPLAPAVLDVPKPTSFLVVARLRPGVTIEAAQTELTTLTPGENPMRSQRGSVTPFVTPDVRSFGAETVWILMGAVACVLLIGGVNVAGLQLARGASRHQELAVRASLGAGRWRLFRLVLTESLVVALVGGALGVLVAWLVLDALVSILPLTFIGRAVTLNPVVLGFATVVSVVSGIMFGLVPAVRLSAVRLGAQSLRPAVGQRGATVSRRASHSLIAVEVALALVLLAGSSLMIRSLLHLHAVDLGFDPSRFVALNVQFVDRSRVEQASTNLLARVRALPGLGIVAAGTGLPLGGSYSRGADLSYVDGTETTEPENGWDTRGFVPGYFEAVGLRRVAGRWPSEADCAAPTLPLVVNESAARRLFGATPAVGQLIFSRKVVHHIAAVAGDVRHSGPREEVVSEIYFCRNDAGAPRSGPFGGPTIVVQTDRETAEVAALLRAAVLGLGERFSNIRISSGDELYAAVTATERHRTWLLTILGALGLVLAIVGVFGMTAYAVTRRTREIGVRMAFGARPQDVVLRAVRDAAVPGAVGLAVGLVAAFFTAPVLGAFLFQMTPRDPWAFGWAAVVLVGTVLVAAWIPARRAASVDPVEALRAE